MASPSSPLNSNLRRQLAQLSDQRQRPDNQEGYVAERHPLMPQLLLVWAPCGCVWVGDKEDNFITPCGLEACVFVWHEASLALEALRQAEKPAEKTSAQSQQPSEFSDETQDASTMISEGGPP